MALAIAPERGRKRKWWDERARESSLEDITARNPIRQSNHNNVHDASDMAYVLVLHGVPSTSPISSIADADMEAPMQDANKFNQWYANRGIEQVVEKHAGLFGRVFEKAYDAAMDGLSYVAGKAISLVPAPARKALVPAGLIVPLLVTACSGSGPKSAYASDVIKIERNQVDGNYNSARGILIIPLDYISNVNGPVQGIVKVNYKGNTIATSEPYTLNPGRGNTDFVVQVPIPLSGTYIFDIVVETLGIQDSNLGNNAAQVAVNATPTAVNPTATLTPENTPTAEPTATSVPPTPVATATPVIDNSYDFGKSLGLDADYLKGVKFDDNSRNLATYLASLPQQMRAIAERSGLIKKLDDKQTASGVIDDRQITSDELGYFKRVTDSYRKNIENVRSWLSQIPEQDSLEALALNLRNFIEAGKGSSMFYTLDSDAMPLLLPQALFTADGIKRMYESEIRAGDKWGHGVNPYATVAVRNITNFSAIQKKAWEVANDPNANYFGHSIDDLLSAGYFEGEAVGSTDKGQNAYEDMNLLLKQGSPEAKAALRLYARNLTSDGSKGSAEQVRVELTEIDLWSMGIPSYTVVLAGHDVPTIPVTLEDIALLKSRSQDPLFILGIDGSYHMPLQWTRKSIVKKEWEEFYLFRGTEAPPPTLKVSDLKSY